VLSPVTEDFRNTFFAAFSIAAACAAFGYGKTVRERAEIACLSRAHQDRQIHLPEVMKTSYVAQKSNHVVYVAELCCVYLFKT
jgi:hypothetical protein